MRLISGLAASDQCHQLTLNIGIAVDVALRGQQRSMTGQHLNITQRATCAVHQPCSLGDERPPAGMR
jgi:hypothetical protein